MEHLNPVDEVVDLLHEVVKEYRLAETHAQVLDLGNKLIIKNQIINLETFVGKALSSEKSASCAP